MIVRATLNDRRRGGVERGSSDDPIRIEAKGAAASCRNKCMG